MQQYHKSKKILLFLTLSVGLGSSGCTLQRMVKTAEKYQQITVEPSPLVTNGQSINFELKAQVPEKLIRDKEVYKLDVYYEYGEQQQRENLSTYSFEFGNFLYEDKQPTITQQITFPYAPEKTTGRLMVQGRAVDKEDGDMAYTSPRQVAVGLNTTPLLLVRNNAYTFTQDTYAEAENAAGKLIFYFEENSTELKNYTGSNLPALEKYALDNVPSQTIKITAWQAPNEKGTRLAAKRAQELEQYYQQKVKALDYSGKKVSISTEVKANTLEALREKIGATALPKIQKQEVLNILNGNQSQPEKLQALQNSQAYTYLKQYVFPGLRAAEVQVNYDRSRKPDYKLYVLAKQLANEKASAETLTEEELQHAATLTPILAEKRKLYEAAVKTTDKWPAYYNLGVVYTEMARKEYRPKVKKALLEQAIHNLTYAGYRNPTAKVYYSLASAYHLLDKYEEAMEYYTYAPTLAGDEQTLTRIFADKAALEIETGKYDEAIQSLQYAGDTYQTNMNLGLSYLLKENYEGAEEFYNKALKLKPNDGMAYYSLALIGARTQNEQLLEQNLRRAVNADKSLMQKAITDLEFSNYRDKPAYKDALIR
ncbi:tetratricopeptide repeat protein [Pontibacter oryzae]|uniref:Tetratricopeptide repeat protein n=1 Tax=Pontibacter oryzae TaxID=2304593 RepID=A0A399SE30_9BACT|nr:tetratricopeptide repeat protein [Pontibacter oryzae]RIJ41448.1 tetratricopeptide repeat protein [Pontibacter oryzae]